MGRLSYPPQVDSPSRQLLLDLTRDLEQLKIHNSELKKVKAYERRSFYENLDRLDSEREAQHNAALDKVAQLHEQVLEEAEETLRAHQRAVEEELRRKEEEARREAERIEKERLEKQRREQEEAARREAEPAAKAEQEAAQRQAAESQKAQAERQRRVGGGRLTEDEVKVQARYVELHQHLKKFRQYLKDEGKRNAAVKQNTGDIRRSIVKSVGQLRRENKGGNKKQIQEIRATLEKASSIAEPSVDIRQFMAFPPPEIANSEDSKVPAMLIYGLNIFSKALIAGLVTEAGIKTEHAEPIGIAAAQIFSHEPFIYKGHPMVDILLAKYRVFCPALWGFCGDEKTEGGRRAVGWRRDGPDGPWISEQAHAERMTALGAGYAAITLRNFGKTSRKNPFPNTMFWQSMHKILSIPVDEIQDTHITLLFAMLRNSAERIVGFFGHVGLGLMRLAIVEFPSKMPHQNMTVNQLKTLQGLYKQQNIII
ncbi:putative RNA export mediator Gle1 [Aspergillus saccharolyticus JOP 1030-1]|uniref:mRNA export factor GLE1 n=1 Tax=Aspergillus saccharolyticus JOP 1030-1 TaxID=1450539 RepID=A0A318ZAL2_9EURO|nr:nuclear pore complex protein An-Gle1 [Aspergillus saccharolyticus JOP 1030-1]PYH44386.1 nuclear pore complex protein An-Gle1 [Aspergillus saccharolyticus JOP 1030-1]